MCVAFWSLEHPRFALVLCSNRDEYLSRPTANAHFHSFGSVSDDTPGQGAVLSGRDLLAGGTWAGINRSGRVALLTNITEPARKYGSSRGSLTSSFLLPSTPSNTLRAEVEQIVAQPTKYAGFNLLLLSPLAVDRSGKQALTYEAAYVTNSGGGGAISARWLSDEERRCGGMSNGIDRMGASEWPKVKHGVQALHDLLTSAPEDATESQLVERLFGLLTWRSDGLIDRSTLRNTIQVEPISVPKPQSPDPAVQEHYGTRLATVILVGRDGRVTFVERDVWKLGPSGAVIMADASNERMYDFTIPLDSR